MYLNAVTIRNVRCFENSGSLPLRKFNLFIGANNSGKTALLSSVELLLRSSRTYGPPHPLAFTEVPGFRSFTSVLRNQWDKNSARPGHFSIEGDWVGQRVIRAGRGARAASQQDGLIKLWGEYQCSAGPVSGEPVVEIVRFGRSREKGAPFVRFAPSGERGYYYLSQPKLKPEAINTLGIGGDEDGYLRTMFFGSFPTLLTAGTRDWSEIVEDPTGASTILADLENIAGFSDPNIKEVRTIKPSRPDPRSVYVLDDPSLDEEQLDLLRTMIRMFSASESGQTEVVEAIRENLNLLGLASSIEVKIPQRQGTPLVEIRIRTHEKYSRQPVTIADVGFGLSQVLPLLVREATLKNGYFVAYEPETHLHPLAQSRLADLFVKSVVKGNRVFVETHSVYLILRLQTLIARGDISADDVSVYCVEASGGKASVTPFLFDEKAVPLRPWPKNFIDTDYVLAKELAQSRQAKK